MPHNRTLILALLITAATLLSACNTMPEGGTKKPVQPDQNPAHQMH